MGTNGSGSGNDDVSRARFWKTLGKKVGAGAATRIPAGYDGHSSRRGSSDGSVKRARAKRAQG